MFLNKKIEIILPLYNEQETIHSTLEEVKLFSNSHPYFYFTFIDDGSADETPVILRNEIKNHNRIKYIITNKNQGKAITLKLGVLSSEADYIIFTDGDLAYSLTYLIQISEQLEESDVVIGNRNLGISRKNSIRLGRIISGEIFNFLVRIILGMKYTDTQAGIKGFRKESALQLFNLQTVENFAFDAELLFIAKTKRYKVYQIPVIVDQKHFKKESSLNLVNDSVKMFFSIMKVFFNAKMGKYSG
jgi:dolichyl-phosphate beta-glucosyltransferase